MVYEDGEEVRTYTTPVNAVPRRKSNPRPWSSLIRSKDRVPRGIVLSLGVCREIRKHFETRSKKTKRRSKRKRHGYVGRVHRGDTPYNCYKGDKDHRKDISLDGTGKVKSVGPPDRRDPYLDPHPSTQSGPYGSRRSGTF